MAIYKKGKNWFIDYRVQGRRKREKIGSNKKLAERVLAKRKVQIAENRFLDILKRPKIRFETLAANYLDYAKTNKLSWDRDKRSIKILGRAVNGKDLSEITPFLIEKYKNERKTIVGPATINRELACLKHMFTKAIQWEMIDSNPVKKVKLLKENNQRLRYLTEEEIQKSYQECSVHLKPIVLTALYTGMRRSEILKLKWEDIDFKQRLIFVRNAKNNRTREIPIADILLNSLKQLNFKSQYVFCRNNGKPWVNIRTGFEGAVKRAGIKDFTFHDLRHTFASHLVMSGADLLTAKELLGHQTINMTLRYAHLSPSHKRKAIENLRFLDGHFLDTKPVFVADSQEITS